MSKTCTYPNCERGCYGEFCLMHKPRKAIKSHPGVAQRKPIKQRGKQYTAWQKTKEAWFETNKAAYYWCHYCGKQMTRSQLTLDHKIPRSRAPELRHAKKNLVPCCWTCNGLKGSVAHDDYAHECATLPRP